jgi:integrase
MQVYGWHLKLLKAHYGKTKLSAISSSDIATYLARQEASGVKGWTRRGRMTVLSGVFSYAARHLGFAGQNPVRALDQVERPSIADEAPKRVLTDDELAALIAAFRPEERLLFQLIAETGLRKSEAAGLTWSNIDVEAMTLTVDGQLDHSSQARVQTKTRRSVRTVVLTPALAGRLREHQLASGRPGDHALVFRRRSGLPWNYSSIDARMRTARNNAGLKPISAPDGVVIARAPVPHDLRHTHASRLIAAGFDIAEVAARLGDSIKTVLAVYAHEWDAVARREGQRDRLSDLYGDTPPQGSTLEAYGSNAAQQSEPEQAPQVADLQAKRDQAQ